MSTVDRNKVLLENPIVLMEITWFPTLNFHHPGKQVGQIVQVKEKTVVTFLLAWI